VPNLATCGSFFQMTGQKKFWLAYWRKLEGQGKKIQAGK